MDAGPDPADPSRPPRLDLLRTPGRRRLLFAALYFSEGAPIGYVWWALPTRLREAGVPIEDVTRLAALLTLPWTLKFLWAPLVDSLRPRRLGLRPWIVGAQLAMGATLIPIASIPLPDGYSLLLGFLLVHAVCAATQDVSIDALAVARIPVEERGGATAWMQVGMLVGRACFGGLALTLERSLGADTVIYLLIAAVWSSSLLVVFAVRDRGPATGAHSALDRLRRFTATLGRVLRMRRTWLGFAIATIAGGAMEATGTIAGPLLVDRGFTKEAVGQFFALPAVVCMAGGALLGGRLSDAGGRRERTLAWAIGALAVGVAAVGGAAALAAQGLGWVLVAALAAVYLLFGVFTAASYALYMDITEPSLGGTQFSAYMGAVNLSAVWSAWVVGRLVAAIDYPLALPVMAVLSLLALPFLGRLRRVRARQAAVLEAAGARG